MKIRRPFRAVVYVAVIAAAVGYVVFSASRQPAFMNGTFVGTTAAVWRGKAPLAAPFKLNPFVYRFSTGWSVHPPYGVVSYLERLTGGVTVHHETTTRRWGVWHSIVETIPDEVRFLCHGDVKQLDDHAERQRLLEMINRSEWGNMFPPNKLSFYASGGGSTRRILWVGVLGDLSILAAFAAIIFSLVKLRREIRWRKPGCCTECDYDLAGLTSGKCPECGAAISHTSRNSATRRSRSGP